LTGLNTLRDSGVAGNGALGLGYTVSSRRIKEKKVKKEGQVVRVNLRVKSKRLLPRKNLVATNQVNVICPKALVGKAHSFFQPKRELYTELV